MENTVLFNKMCWQKAHTQIGIMKIWVWVYAPGLFHQSECTEIWHQVMCDSTWCGETPSLEECKSRVRKMQLVGFAGHMGLDHGRVWHSEKGLDYVMRVVIFDSSGNRERRDHSVFSAVHMLWELTKSDKFDIFHPKFWSFRGRWCYFQLGKTDRHVWNRRHAFLALNRKGQSYETSSVNGEQIHSGWSVVCSTKLKEMLSCEVSWHHITWEPVS